MKRPSRTDDHFKRRLRIQERLVFRLYITRGAPSSARALENLEDVCRDYFPENHEIEIVDTVQDPLRAKQDGIVITPALVKLSPAPQWTIVGDLSEDARVLASMRERKGNHAQDGKH